MASLQRIRGALQGVRQPTTAGSKPSRIQVGWVVERESADMPEPVRVFLPRQNRGVRLLCSLSQLFICGMFTPMDALNAPQGSAIEAGNASL